MMEKPFRDTQEYFQAFIRTAQYIPNLTSRQDILSETGRVLISFFKADLVGFFEPGKDGRIEGHHWILPEGVVGNAILNRETETIIAGVLETGFLAAQQIDIPEPVASVFLPIIWENQTAAVMLVGHRTSDPLPKELLNIYLAVAGLVSNAITGADEEFKNIAARKRAEEALRDARAQLAFLVSNTPVVLYRCSASADFKMAFISENVRLQLGYEAHEFTDDPAFWPDHIHPDDRERVSNGLPRVIEKGTTTSEYRLLAKDGTYHWIRDEVRAVRDASGQPVEYLGYWIDITDRKRAEAALSAIAREWEITFNATSDAICLIDADQKIQRCNIQMSKILGGISQEEIVGMPCWAIVHKTTGPIPDCPFVSTKKTLYRTKIELPAGKLWFEVTADPILDSNGKFTGAVHIMRDITARKLAEEALRLQNQIFETIAEGVYLIRTRDGVIVYTNSKFETMFGYENGELIGKHVSVVNAPEEKMSPRDTADEIMKALTEKGGWRGEVKNLRKDGTTFWCLAAVSTFEHPEFGSVWISAHTDITSRKQAEEAVQAAVKLNQLIDTLSVSESMGYIINEAERLTTSRIGFFHLINPNEQTIQLVAWSTGTKKHCFIPKEPERNYPVSKAGVWVDCLRERKPVIHNDYARLPLKKGLPEGHVPVTRELVVPIFDEDKIVAIIGVGNKATDYDEADINVMTLLGGNAWTLIRRKRADEEREKIRLWQAGVNRILESVLAPVPLDQKLKIITDGVVETFGADFCRIWLIEKGDLCNTDCMHADVIEGPHACRYRDKCLHLKSSSGRYTHIDGKAHRRVPFGAYKIGRIASGVETRFLTNDVEHDPQVHDHEWAKSLGLVSFSGYRLKPPGGDVLGVFALFARFPISPDMDAILDGLSHAISLTIQKDVTEEALRESEQKFRDIFNNTADAIILHEIGVDGRPGKFIDVNDVLSRMLEYTREEMLTKTPLDITTNYHNPSLEKIFEEQRTTGSARFETEYRAKDGTIVPVEVHTQVVIIHGKNLMLGAVRDITARKRAEEALMESEATLHSILQGSPMLQFVIDKDHRVISWNKAIEEYSGIKEGEVLGTRNHWKAFYDAKRPILADLLLDDNIEHLLEWYQGISIKKSGYVEGAYEVTDFFPNMGESGKWLYFTAAPVRNVKGEIIGVVETLEDITERKNAEEALSESERRFREIFNNVNDAIELHEFRSDGLPGKYLEVNDVTCMMLQYSREELLRHSPLDFTTEYHNRPLSDIGKELLTLGHSQFETEHMRKDGTIVPVEINAHVIILHGITVVLSVVRDITDRKLAEEALRQVNKKLEPALEYHPARYQQPVDCTSRIS